MQNTIPIHKKNVICDQNTFSNFSHLCFGGIWCREPPRRGHASVDKVKPCNDSDIDVGGLPSVGSNSDVADANFS